MTTGTHKEETVLSFDYGPPPPKFDNPLEERQHVKEQLALAFRILAREGMCKLLLEFIIDHR